MGPPRCSRELTKGTGMMAAAELSHGYLAAALEVPTHKRIVIDDKTRKICVQPRHGARAHKILTAMHAGEPGRQMPNGTTDGGGDGRACGSPDLILGFDAKQAKQIKLKVTNQREVTQTTNHAQATTEQAASKPATNKRKIWQASRPDQTKN